MRRRFLALVLLVAAVASACANNGDSTAAFDARADEADIVIAADEPVDDGEQAEPAVPTTTTEVVIADEPAVRIPANAEVVEASNWIARTAMTAASVELVWSPVEGASTYRLYRLPTADADYEAIATGDLGNAEEIFEANPGEYGFIDLTAPSGQFLTYLIVAELDGNPTEPRWTEALTVDDVTPPTPITGLTAAVTSEGILLEWEPSVDDVEFAAYNVQVLAPDGTAQYLGGGADVGQVSFLDTEPFDGENQYFVTAVDFHNNTSESATVTISN